MDVGDTGLVHTASREPRGLESSKRIRLVLALREAQWMERLEARQ